VLLFASATNGNNPTVVLLDDSLFKNDLQLMDEADGMRNDHRQDILSTPYCGGLVS
jgi:hypothetical protein